FAHLEGGDRLAGGRCDGPLTGDHGQISRSALDLLAIGNAFTDTHVQHDLLDLRDHHDVLVAELFHKLGANDFFVVLLQARLVIGWARRWRSVVRHYLRLGGLAALLGIIVVRHDLFLLRNYFARALGDAHFCTVLQHLDPDPRRLAVAWIFQRQIRQVDRRFLGDDPALGLRCLALVTADHVHAANESAAFLGPDLDHFAVLALIPACQDDNVIALFDFRQSHLTVPPARATRSSCGSSL